MKINDGCALERKTEDGWIPMAIRHQRLSKQEKALLNRGDTVLVDGQQVRRYDWAERKALLKALEAIGTAT